MFKMKHAFFSFTVSSRFFASGILLSTVSRFNFGETRSTARRWSRRSALITTYGVTWTKKKTFKWLGHTKAKLQK